MTLKGDLREINLADIFQTLGMNQQEGTLTVFSETKRTNIYFGQEGIRLLTSDRQKYPRLGEILVRRHKISSTELQEALEKQKESGALLGEILIFQETVTEQEIEESVRSQIEEIIYDVFSWKDAKFEFIAGEPLEEFFDQTATGRKITFNISGIIMEAARRIDEWDLVHEVIPSMSSIYASAVDSPTFNPDQADYPQKMVLEVMLLVDGMRSVEEICDESPYSSFETSKIIAFLVKENQLRPLTAAELMAAGFRVREEGRLEDAVAIYRSVVETDPGHEAAREALAEIFTRLGRSREAGDEFAELGKLAKEAGDEDKAFEYMEKAAELSPKNIEIHRQLLQMYLAKGRLEDAGKEANLVAKAYWHLGKHYDARDVLEALLKEYPQHVECRQLMVNILIELNDKGGVVKNYEALAREYGSRNEMVKVRQIYEKILNIEPHRKDLKAKIDSLRDPQGRRRKMPGWAKFIIVLIVIAVPLGGGGAAWVYWNDRAEKDFTELSQKLEQRIRQASQDAETKEDPMLLQQALDEAKDELDALKHRYRWSKLVLFETRIGSKRTKFETEVREKKTAIEDRLSGAKATNDKLNAEAVMLYESGKYEEALSKYRKLDLKYLPELGRSAIKQRILEIEEYLTEAKTTLSELTDYEAEIKRASDTATKLRFIKAAFEAAQRLSRYHYSTEKRLVRFPLYLDTQPAGASVIVNGAPHRERTPTVVHYGLDAPTVEIRIEKFSFHSQVFRLVPKSQSRRVDGWRHSLALAKKQAWQFKGKARIACEPEAYGTLAVIGDLDGKLHFITTDEGKEIWHFDPSEALAEFAASPRIVSNRAYVPSTNRYCYAVDLIKRREIWKQLLPAPIIYKPAFAGGKLFVATGRTLHALDSVAAGKILWSAEIEKTGLRAVIRTAPTVVGENVVVATGGGQVRAHSVADGNSAWVHTLTADAIQPIAALGKLALVPCGDGMLHGLDISTGKLAWSFKVGSNARNGVATPVTVSGSRVYFGSGDGRLICLDCADRPELKWQYQLSNNLTVAPAVLGSVVYASLSDGSVIAFEMPGEKKEVTLEEKWQFGFPPGSEIVGASIIHKTLVVALKDGALYAFEE